MKILKTLLRYLLAAFFVLAGINHFRDPEFYTKIMPLFLPLHKELVLLSGVTEIIAGAMLLYKPTIRWGAWGIVAMLVLFFLVHIDMIVHADRFSSVPLGFLYARVVLQFVLIAWAWWYTLPEKPKTERVEA